MSKVATSCIFWSAILICLDCRPLIDLGSKYKKAFESANCDWDKLHLNSSESDTKDTKSQLSISVPMKLCFNTSLINRNMTTFNLCDEIFSILYEIHCSSVLQLEDLSLNIRGWNEPTDICQSFKNANFIKPDSLYYTSTTLKIENLCKLACVKENEVLCKLLLWEQEIKHLHTVQSENQNASKITDMEHSESSSPSESSFSTPIAVYINEDTEVRSAPNDEINKLNLKNHVTEPNSENMSSASSKQKSKFNSNLLVVSNNNNENMLNDVKKTSNDVKKLSNEVKKMPNAKITNSLNTVSPTASILKVLNEEQPDESVDNLNNSTYLNNDLHTNFDNANSNGLTSKETINNSIYEKTTNDSIMSNPSLNSKVDNENQSTISKSVFTVLESDEELTANDGDTKTDFELNDQQSLKEINFNNSSSSSIVLPQSINVKHIENAQASFNDANESTNEMFLQSQKMQIEKTGTMPVFITKNSDDLGIETSIDDESAFFNTFNRPVPNEIEAKKSDMSMLSKFTVDTLSSTNEDIFHKQQNSGFIFYFILSSLSIITLYVIIHNKQKIVALIVEGCQERRRRPHGVSYRKLDTN